MKGLEAGRSSPSCGKNFAVPTKPAEKQYSGQEYVTVEESAARVSKALQLGEAL